MSCRNKLRKFWHVFRNFQIAAFSSKSNCPHEYRASLIIALAQVLQDILSSPGAYIFSITRKISPAERPSSDGSCWMTPTQKRIIKQFILYYFWIHRFLNRPKNEPQIFRPFVQIPKPSSNRSWTPFRVEKSPKNFYQKFSRPIFGLLRVQKIYFLH